VYATGKPISLGAVVRPSSASPERLGVREQFVHRSGAEPARVDLDAVESCLPDCG
jgi:hypothetical protein